MHNGIPPPRSRHPPEADTPQKQTPPRKQTPLGSRHPQEADTPWEAHPTPPGKQTPPWHMVNEWPVHILLECILVIISDSKYLSHSIDSLSKLQSKRLATTSVSLYTQTGSPCLASHILNKRASFIYISYTSLTSIHYNLEHGLAIVTESFNPLDLDYITSFVQVGISSPRDQIGGQTNGSLTSV